MYLTICNRPTQLRARQREISHLEINKAVRLNAIVVFYKVMAFSIQFWSNYTAGTSKSRRISKVAVQSEYIWGIVQISKRDQSYKVTVSSSYVNMLFFLPINIIHKRTAHMELNVL